MTRAAYTMEEAAALLNVSRRTLQEIVKRYPFYYPNGNRKLFTDGDIETIRIFTEARPTKTQALVKFLAEKIGVDATPDLLTLFNGDTSVYFVTCGPRLKIGFTTNWPGRYRILKTSCPDPVSVVAVIPAKRKLEQFLHIGLSGSRSNGEWFRIEGDVAALIAAMDAAQ